MQFSNIESSKTGDWSKVIPIRKELYKNIAVQCKATPALITNHLLRIPLTKNKIFSFAKASKDEDILR